MLISEFISGVSPDFTIERSGNQVTLSFSYYLTGYFDEELGYYVWDGEIGAELGASSGYVQQTLDGPMDLQFTATLASGVTTSGSYYLNDSIGGAALTSDFTVTLFDVKADFTGTAGSDVVFGSASADKLLGEGGNDFLIGGKGNDTLAGRDGDDVLSGGEGSNYLSGGSGRDTVSYAGSASGVWVQLMDLWGDNGSGVDTYNSIENIIGSDHGDTLMGNDGANLIIGGGGANYLHGHGGNDRLIGGDFANIFYGDAGNDVLIGGAGNDTFRGGQGADQIDGGGGSDDVASYSDAPVGVVVSLTDQSINTGVAKGDTLTGIEGLHGSNYADKFYGDANDNWLYGGIGNDVLSGGDGNDILIGEDGSDQMDGGGGRDRVSYENMGSGAIVSLADQSLNAGSAAGDILVGVEDLYGTSRDDTFYGDGNANRLYGDMGADTLFGSGGNDTLNGGIGNDILHGGEGDDSLQGSNGNDVLHGGAGADTLRGFASTGDDGGSDTASYETATARVVASLQNRANNTGDAAGDRYYLIDNLRGSDHGDSLAGDGFGNVIDGGAGNDTLRGYGGKDTLSGGDGKDIFVFSSALSASANVDAITDFNVADDTIRLEAHVFSALPAGALAATAFTVNANGTAGDADDRIIYNSTNGRLFYDADGTGATAAIWFASLWGSPAITAADFAVI
ncbi:calcium-binding protein [Mesorhizobium sp. LHD-90]|uniref:calcium-binding protein n=1 Tax=Mesorhizobium sp. LHD-90 TaxID=3071414 RepID=UPI0027DF0D0D|nr:calcium-binding protein [Mesorhizobium sp. LHD-90]MDQ6437245.1 calcium-binding protein [Mesorhizobium sp. LHD-90]